MVKQDTFGPGLLNLRDYYFQKEGLLKGLLFGFDRSLKTSFQALPWDYYFGAGLLFLGGTAIWGWDYYFGGGTTILGRDYCFGVGLLFEGRTTIWAWDYYLGARLRFWGGTTICGVSAFRVQGWQGWHASEEAREAGRPDRPSRAGRAIDMDRPAKLDS